MTLEHHPPPSTYGRISDHSRRRGARSPVICAVLAILAFAAPISADDSPMGTAFRKDFDRLDRDFWFVSDGWTNGPHQNCDWSSRAVDVAGGMLTLSFLPLIEGEYSQHLCGEIQTKAVYHHGTYEARIRTSKGSGLNAAFFTYIGPVHDKPHDEIDVEILTHDTGAVSFNTFVDGKPHNGTAVSITPATDQSFRIYSFVWSPDSIRWFIDGKEVHRATGTLPVTPQKIYLSHWGSDTLVDWMGPFETPPGPVVMTIDWVAFTPLNGRCQFAESVVCKIE